MAAFTLATLGTIAGLTGETVTGAEAGAAVVGQAGNNWGYRKRHPLTHVYEPSAKRARTRDWAPGYTPGRDSLFQSSQDYHDRMETPVRMQGVESSLHQRRPPTPAVTRSTNPVNTKIGGAIQFAQLPYPDQVTSPSVQYNRRDSPIILYKGVKICRWWVNAAGAPVTIHWALIQLKQGHYTPELSTEDGGLANLFFRSHEEGDATDREANFTGYANTGTLEAFDTLKSCAPMNPDRFYKVLTRRKFNLPGINTPQTTPEGKNVRKFAKYFRVNKHVHWRDSVNDSDPEVEMPIIEVWWSDYKSPLMCGTISTEAIHTWTHHTAYYRSRNVT